MTSGAVIPVVLLPESAAKFRVACYEDAVECIGTLTPGCRVCGLTKGHFSMMDLLHAVLDQTGPADVVVGTWTIGLRDAQNAAYLAQQGLITRFEVVTDYSFATRKSADYAAVRGVFGDYNVHVTKTHAKYFMVANATWHIVVRGSMNFTRNPRFEQFDLDDSLPMYEFYDRMVSEIREANHGPNATNRTILDNWAAMLGPSERPEVITVVPLSDEERADLAASFGDL